VTDKPHRIPQSLPVVNYRPAIVRAVEWLGNRYLLAKPINAGPSRESPAIPRQERASG
jgi:hypothetical protein